MKVLQTVVTLLAIFGLIISTDASKRGNKKKQRPFMKCLGGDVKMSRAMSKSIIPCRIEIGPTEMAGETEKKAIWGKNNLCWQTCVWKNLGWIDEDNKFNLGAVNLMVDEIFPEKAIESIKAEMEACPKDPITIEKEGCLGLDPLKQCFMNAIKSGCKTTPAS